MSLAEKALIALLLIAVITISVFARAPRQAISGPELRRLMLGALCLYAAGAAAALSDHPTLAICTLGTGVIVAALAAWLSRGSDQDDPPGGVRPFHRPPPEPDGVPEIDWDRFERDLRDWARRRSEPAAPDRRSAY